MGVLYEKLVKLFLSIIVSLIAVFAIVGNAQSVRANQDWGDQFITHAELQDEAGNPQSSFGIYDSLKAYWEFNIPAGTEIKLGDSMTVNIPKVLTLQSDVTFDINDTAGEIIGHAIADHNTGVVTITFTDYAAQVAQNGIIGNFTVWVHWDHSEVDENTSVHLDWGSGGETNINVNSGDGKPDEHEEIHKWGYVDQEDPSLIHWTVRMNFALADIQNAIYTDTVGPNQKLETNSIWGYHVASWNSDWTPIPGSPLNSETITQTDSTHFSVNLGNLTDCVYIAYSTRATDGGSSSKYQNSGSLSGDEIENQVVDVYTPDNGGGGDGDLSVSESGTKIWIDDNNAAGLRPQSIIIALYQNDEKIDSKVVTEADNWEYHFQNLPKYDENNQEYKYTLKEENVEHYISTQDGTNFINTITGEIEINGKKSWIDDNNLANQRPKSIVINLLADGKKIRSKTVTEKEDWSYDFGVLPKYQNGKVISYRITEDTVKGYRTTVNGFNVTNTYAPIVSANPAIPASPDLPISQIEGGKEKSMNNNQPFVKKEISRKSLPKTGEKAGANLENAGFSLLIVLIWLLIFRAQKKNSVD